MNIKRKNIFTFAGLLCLLFLLSSASAQAQTISFNYSSRVEMGDATDPPDIRGLPEVDYPEAARKNGVEGTLKATMTLGENGRIRDIVITRGLPHGINEALTNALLKMTFQPAQKDGQPVPVKMHLEFTVTVGFDEGDKNVTKPKIIEKPEPVYPQKYRAEKLRGKVQVGVMFNADGTLKIINVSSVMPKEFDQAAREAVAKIKFEPAVHKKSKKPVGQAVTIEYDFKP